MQPLAKVCASASVRARSAGTPSNSRGPSAITAGCTGTTTVGPVHAGHGGGKDDLVQPVLDLGELEVGATEITGTLWGLACRDGIPERDDGLVQHPAHRPGVRGPEIVVEIALLRITPRERLPEAAVRVSDPAVQRRLHSQHNFAHIQQPAAGPYAPGDRVNESSRCG